MQYCVYTIFKKILGKFEFCQIQAMFLGAISEKLGVQKGLCGKYPLVVIALSEFPEKRPPFEEACQKK